MKYPDNLPYVVIEKATHGDVVAMNEVLERYDGYINTLSSRRIIDKHGNSVVAVDDDIKGSLQSKLIAAVLQFDPR